VALPHSAASAVQAVHILAEEAEGLQKQNIRLTAQVDRLSGEVSSLQQAKYRLEQEIEKWKKYVETLEKEMHNKNISNEEKLQGEAHGNLFSRTFQHIDTDDGWVPIADFFDAMKEIDSSYTSSPYWKSTIFSTVQAYPDLIEMKKERGCFFVKSHTKQTPSSMPSTLSVSSQENRPTDNVYNIFSYVSPPYTFFLLNDDMKLNRNRQFLI
jgi:hypothetical protein